MQCKLQSFTMPNGAMQRQHLKGILLVVTVLFVSHCSCSCRSLDAQLQNQYHP